MQDKEILIISQCVILRRANKKLGIKIKIKNFDSPDVRIYLNEPKAHSLHAMLERLPRRTFGAPRNDRKELIHENL